MSANLPASGTAFRTHSDFALQSTPKHVAIIMDGNRRWARERGMPASAGHRHGARALERLLPAVAAASIDTLTLFGFSSANWARDPAEVSHLMRLAESALRRCQPHCVREGITLEVIGRRDRLPAPLRATIRRVERATADGRRRLRVAIDYSSRAAILTAAREATDGDPAALTRHLGGDVDLLIRTGRDQRLSDFLLWECAFAELYFPDLCWPDFDPVQLDRALAWYAQRERRFGR